MSSLARLGALTALLVALSCGSSPKCFECGLTKEWARAEAEEQKRKEQAGEGPEVEASDAERPQTGPEGQPPHESPEPAEPPPPIPPPEPNAEGCVSVGEYQAYAKALDAHAQASLDELVKAQGATAMIRDGFFVEGRSEPPDSVYTVSGKRFAIVGMGDASIRPPKVSLAKAPDGALHPLHPRGSGYAVEVTVCGTNPCVYGSGARVQVAPIAIELSSDESIGPPLAPSYESWWAMAGYTQYRDCGPPPP